MKEIVIYSTDYCPYCRRAKDLLKSKGASFDEIRVDEHPEKMTEMVKRAGGKRTVPQIFIADYHVGGCDELYELERQGKLNDLLKGLAAF